MIIVKWQGYAASSNKRHTKSRTTGNIINMSIYRDFKINLSWAIKAAAGNVCYDKLSVIINVCVSKRMDHHNLHKPIMDAIQLSGLLKNDKNIHFISWTPPEWHKEGEVDTVFLFLSEVK